MASEHRTAIDTIEDNIAELSQRIRSFDFIAAVRQLECVNSSKPRVGESVRVQDDILRLSQHAGLGFQGNALHAIESGSGASAHRLYVNFFGLLGSYGPLPLHYTEYADQRTRHHADPTFKEFLDLFNHRMLSLFYRASVQFDPAIMFDRSSANSYEEFLGALCGYLPDASSNRDSVPDGIKRHFPAWFSSTAKSPDGIQAIVGDYFKLPVIIKEWVGSWLALPKDAQSRLDGQSHSVQLGRAFYIGKRVWSIRHKFTVQLGPLDWCDFSAFKPGGARAKSLHDLVRNYVGDEWDWDLELVLKAGEVRPLALNRSCALGFDSWVTSAGYRHPGSHSVLLNKQLIGQLAN